MAGVIRALEGVADAADRDGAQAKIAYRDMKGSPYEQPLWQILLHVVNHGTHHRGQAAGFLAVMATPASIDLIAFYRTIPA